MSTTLDTVQPGAAVPSHPNRALWAAIGVLGVAVAALGTTLVVQQRSAGVATPAPVAVSAAVGQPLSAAPTEKAAGKMALPEDDRVPEPPRPAARAVEKKPAPQRPAPAPAARAPVHAAAPAPAVAAVPAPAPARAVCASCGTVESVTPVQQAAAPSGVGAVAGGVLGAVVGNQIGKGSGRTAATVLGAVGGGLLGHNVEKNVRRETIYRIGVRMEDGSVRTVERAAPVNVGAPVTLEGGTLRTADGAVVPAVRVAPAPQPAAQPVYTGG